MDEQVLTVNDLYVIIGKQVAEIEFHKAKIQRLHNEIRSYQAGAENNKVPARTDKS